MRLSKDVFEAGPVSVFAVLLLLLMAALMPGASVAAPGMQDGLFGSQERKRPVIGQHPFKAWARVVDQHFADLRAAEICATQEIPECKVLRWLDGLGGLRGRELAAKLEEVNTELNAKPYLTDLRNWGQEDYWETPLEFLTRHGDCEGYSIAKYMALRELGVPIERMRIAVVNDENLGIGHAILVVYSDDRRYILDNQTDQVVEAARIRHYTPIYSLNETAWWLHRN